MLDWLKTGKGYITVLYNLALVVIIGTILGILMERVTQFFGFDIREIRHFDESDSNQK